MALTGVGTSTSTTIVAASATAGSAPTAGTDGFTCDADGGRVRTLIDYTGAVTAAVVRIYFREPGGGGAWFRGVSTTESGFGLAPASGDEARDWDVGEHSEFTFVLESITPSGSTPTVAVRAVGVNR